MPHEKFQYNMEMLEIVESYYKANANKKGDALAQKLWDIAEHDIIYYSQLSSYFEQSLKYEKQVSFGLVQNLLDILEQHKRNELLLELDTRLEKLIGATE